MKTEFKKSLLQYVLAAIFGALGGLLTILIVIALDYGIHLIWESTVGIDTSAPTRTPAVFAVMASATLFVSYVVFRYGKANTGLEQIIHEIVKDGTIAWRKLPKAFVISFPSLLSGASLGPEAPAAILSVTTTGAISENRKFSPSQTQHANAAAFSGMLGSILSSPFLAPAMIAETAKSKVESIKSLLTTSLVASAFGIATFFTIFGKVYELNLPTESYAGSTYYELFAAFLFGLGGCIFAIVVAKILVVVNKAFDSFLKSDTQKVLFTGFIISVLMYIVPITMFSGQHTLDTLYEQSITAGFFSLLAIAFVKILSTSLLLRAGFIGGAVFPTVFTGVALGLALNQIFQVTPAVAVVATTVGLLTLLLRQPLSAAILVLLFFGFTSGAAVACGVAGALLVLALLPKVD